MDQSKLKIKETLLNLSPSMVFELLLVLTSLLIQMFLYNSGQGNPLQLIISAIKLNFVCFDRLCPGPLGAVNDNDENIHCGPFICVSS